MPYIASLSACWSIVQRIFPSVSSLCTARILSKPTTRILSDLSAALIADTAPSAILSFAQRTAFRSAYSVTIADTTWFAFAVSQYAVCELTMFIPPVFIASSKPSVRCIPLNALGTPSIIATLSLGLNLPAKYSPASRAPLRLSGPTKGILTPLSARTPASNLLSILTTVIPASIARLHTGTSAFESAGAITIASTF